MINFKESIINIEQKEKDTESSIKGIIKYIRNRENEKNTLAKDAIIIDGIYDELISHYTANYTENITDFFRKLYNDIIGNWSGSMAHNISSQYNKKIIKNLAFLIDCYANGYFDLDNIDFCVKFLEFYNGLTYIDFERRLFVFDNVKEERNSLNEWHLNNISNKIEELNEYVTYLHNYIQNKEGENEKRVYKNTR